MPRTISSPLKSLAALTLVLAAATACGNDGPESGGEGGEERTLTVLAAASLTETFTELGEEFESANPGVTVEFAFDSSATLASQAVQGAPADVLATADLVTMQDAVDADALLEDPETFAANVLTLVVPAGNPAGVASLDDLTSGVDYVTCVETAPCGNLARTLLDAAGVTADPASLETDVKATLAKVTQDEADAGLVYRTDATAAGEAVEAIEIPGAEEEPLDYPIGVLQQSQDADLAAEFVALVLSPEGRAILESAGFAAP